MFKAIALLGYVAASDFAITDVSCDGVGGMSISYTFTPSNDADTLDRFAAGPNSDDTRCIAEGTELSSPLVFNPYTCKGRETGDDLSSFNVQGAQGHFTVHSTAKVGGETFNLRAFNMEVSCVFENSYTIESKPQYNVQEDSDTITFDTFEMASDDFTLTLDSTSLSANEQLTATFGTQGDKWGKLNAEIQFAPTSCSVSETGNSFQILGGGAGACGYPELLTSLSAQAGGRSWTLAYQTFVMTGNGGQYTLTCEVTMCTAANRATGGSCAASYAC